MFQIGSNPAYHVHNNTGNTPVPGTWYATEVSYHIIRQSIRYTAVYHMRDKQTGAGAWLAVWAMGIHTDRPRVTFQSKTLKAKKTKTDQHQPTKDIGERCPSTWTDGQPSVKELPILKISYYALTGQTVPSTEKIWYEHGGQYEHRVVVSTQYQ